MTFREAPEHGVPGKGRSGGKIRVIRSPDGKKWDSAALLDWGKDQDLRDSKLSITPAGELMLLCAAAPQASPRERQSLVFTSKNGTNWGDALKVAEHNYWLWRATWHRGKAYGVGYACNSTDRHNRLYVSADGIEFKTLVKRFNEDGFPNEASIIFLKNDRALCLLRRDGGSNNTALLGTASPPYTKWSWKDLKIRIGGPHMLRLPDGRIVAAGRLYTPVTRTALMWLDPDKGSLDVFLTLPSGGDTSYPGLVWHDGILWVSYYSSHEGKTAIYLAKVKP
jgi:hypothetical protein